MSSLPPFTQKPASPPYSSTTLTPLFPNRPGISIASQSQVIRINVLPDNVLLEIFDFYVKNRSHRITKRSVEIWHPLVHVCRRWRSLIFESPHRLDLRLLCTPITPSKDTLGVWPALPLIIKGDMALSSDVDNIVVALGHSNHVCEINLWEIGQQQLEKVLATMQVQYQELIKLRLKSHDDETLPVPDSFLGGSAPRLQLIRFEGIAFPGLPKLLLSATHFVKLDLFNIPHSGYFSPETMVALLSALSSLERLSLGFKSPQSRPDSKIRRPPLTRSVIPSLARFIFKGVSEYLEDLVTCIDAPQLDELKISFFNQIDFDTPQLAQFISRTPTFRTRAKAHVQFGDSAVEVKLTYQTHEPGNAVFRIKIICEEPDWQLSSIVQVCNSSLPPLNMVEPPLNTVEDLYIEQYYFLRGWQDDAIENTQWLELLRPFTAVKNLNLSKKFMPGIAAALQELVGDRIMKVLPSLRQIFVQELQSWEPVSEHIVQFVAARQLSGHPVAIFV